MMRLCFVPAVVSLLLFTGASVRLLAGPDTPKQFDQKLFQELRWRLIGPFRGGRVLAVTGVRGQPETYYFGAVGRGGWKTNDPGRKWKPVFDSRPVSSHCTIPSQKTASQIGRAHARTPGTAP